MIGKRDGVVHGDQICVRGKMDEASITFLADTECFDRLLPRRDVSNHEKVAGDLGRPRAEGKPFSVNPTRGSIRALEPELAREWSDVACSLMPFVQDAIPIIGV